VWTILALSVSVLTLYSMMKIWMEAFWKSHPDPQWQLPATARLAPAWMATVGLATITVLIGLNPQPLAGFAAAAARSLGL
jgi:multicomponent Na+:H+ antiporter subunit D